MQPPKAVHAKIRIFSEILEDLAATGRLIGVARPECTWMKLFLHMETWRACRAIV